MLETLADVAAIATAAAAVGAFGYYRFKVGQRKARLVSYLRKEANSQSNEGLRSMPHLMARLRMTESEILQASFDSKHITCKLRIDEETGLANQLLFGYEESPTTD